MKILVQLFCLVSFAILLNGCDPALTRRDNESLLEWRGMREDPAEKASIFHRLVYNNPEKMAAADAKKGNYKLVSLAMGYHAKEKDAKILGVKCTAPVETQSIVTGCVPPPTVFFKLMKRYNVALIAQQGFPAEAACTEDKALDVEFQRMDDEMEDRIEADSARRIREWEERAKKTRMYNP